MKKVLLTLSVLAIAAALSSCASTKKEACHSTTCAPEVVCSK